jgi:hypothetical protein
MVDVFMALLSFVESAPRAYRLKASNAAPLISTSAGTFPKSKVGEITMDNELLYAKIEALEGKRPLAHKRSRR